MTPIVRASALTKSYGKAPVLNGLSFEVPEGSVFGLIGPNGAGKTTTLKILMNILQAASGRAEVLGADSRELAPHHFTQIGYVSENQEMPGWMTVRYLMEYVRPFYPTWDAARAAELLRTFDLPPNRQLRKLSRGMWMKAALASSLAYRPKLLVLDEPFSGLDPLVREDLIAGLLDSIGETTILISSHDLADIETFASHIAYLHAGKFVFSEEMTSLISRFRQVEVTLHEGTVPSDEVAWPATWLRRESTRALVRFVDSRFEPARSAHDIQSSFGEVQRVSIEAMPLRTIFLTVARHSARAE